ncbi:MAG: 4Fe-4S binding protein [Phycisphaerae bacterium]|nr:4Fe-4S binding protein [Phycisphaerae bacterium]
MLRKIIEINEELCDGCGNCIPNCPEGALQVIDGKARVVSDLACDGLGACIGHCPTGAMKVVQKEAVAYNEVVVMENIIKAGPATILAHLKHLDDHNQGEYLAQAIDVLKAKGIAIPQFRKPKDKPAGSCSGGCPGSMMINNFSDPSQIDDSIDNTITPSQLKQWPVQLTLVNPSAPYFADADLLVAADCVPFAMGDFHRKLLKDKVVVIFCPKLDADLNSYVEKLTAILSNNNIKSITTVRMEVPCCGGTNAVLQKALAQSGKNIPVKEFIISLKGETL